MRSEKYQSYKEFKITKNTKTNGEIDYSDVDIPIELPRIGKVYNQYGKDLADPLTYTNEKGDFVPGNGSKESWAAAYYYMSKEEEIRDLHRNPHTSRRNRKNRRV